MRGFTSYHKCKQMTNSNEGHPLEHAYHGVCGEGERQTGLGCPRRRGLGRLQARKLGRAPASFTPDAISFSAVVSSCNGRLSASRRGTRG